MNRDRPAIVAEGLRKSYGKTLALDGLDLHVEVEPIDVGTESYVNYLMAGNFVQTVAFGAVSTGVGLAEDLQKGLVDRFRSLPMARSAVLTGRTIADLVRNLFVVLVMLLVGLVVGFRPEAGLPARPADRHARLAGPRLVRRNTRGLYPPLRRPVQARRRTLKAACGRINRRIMRL